MSTESPLSIRERWNDFLSSQLANKTNDKQFNMLMTAWFQILQDTLNIRPPFAAKGEDGYCFTWRYTDREGTLILEVAEDGTALWMYRKNAASEFVFVDWKDPFDSIPEIIKLAAKDFCD